MKSNESDQRENIYGLICFLNFSFHCTYRVLINSLLNKCLILKPLGHKGWGCNDPSGGTPDFKLLVTTLLLTLTNMATLPAVVLALFR